MKLKSIEVTLTVILLSISFALQAQSYAESAGLFGRINPGGSARIQGMGGAQIALGGDYSSSLSNPAGLGMYNHSEVSFSPGFYTLKTSSNYIGSKDSDIKTNLNIPGFSVVFNNTRKCDCKGFLGGSVGISFSRVNDFNQSFQYHGTNTNTSLIDEFVDNSNFNGYDPSQFDHYDNDPPYDNQYNTPTGLGYYTYLFDYSPPGGYKTDNKNIPFQHELVKLKGATNQFNISYGANINDIFFFGAGLGISSLNYTSSKTYGEDFPDTAALNGLLLHEKLSLKGSGVNVTLGGIVRPINFLQIGLSYTSPTYSEISDTWSADMRSTWKAYDDEYAESDIVKSNYALVTPSKLSTGIAFISKYGLISGDLETMNIGGARYSATTTNDSYSTDNNEIKSTFKRVLNYRIGAEGRYSIFRIRGGYNVQANTYKVNYNGDNTITSISGGAGIKLKKYSIDFALISSSSKGIYSPYSIAPTVALKNNLVRGIFTFAATF